MHPFSYSKPISRPKIVNRLLAYTTSGLMRVLEATSSDGLKAAARMPQTPEDRKEPLKIKSALGGFPVSTLRLPSLERLLQWFHWRRRHQLPSRPSTTKDLALRLLLMQTQRREDANDRRQER